MGEAFADSKTMLKELIKALHYGANPEEVKERFRQTLAGAAPSDVEMAEQELVGEGMPAEEVRRLCDVHLAMLEDEMKEPEEEGDIGPGHPVHILLAEHEFVKRVVEELESLLPELGTAANAEGVEDSLSRIGELLGHLQEYEKHKVREENALFPYLERHGMTQPPAIMWMEHDQQRAEIKEAVGALEERTSLGFSEFKSRLVTHLGNLTAYIPSHFFKEENILFPASLSLISSSEWREIKASMDELGYCDFTPPEAIGRRADAPAAQEEQAGMVAFETGAMTRDELEAMLDALPIDITFIDATNTVRYFNQAKDRFFPRAKAIIGRTVQQCHPQRSIHLVNQIVDEMRSSKRDMAEFWIDARGRKLHIRYFAVRGKEGEYLGCLGIDQDVTEIQKLTGEKRLL